MSKKFSDLTQLTAPDGTDIIPVDDVSAATTKYITLADLMKMASAIPNNSITGAMLATSAITLGYASIVAFFATPSTTGAQVTGLTVSVTIPAGGRRVKITAFCPTMYSTTAANAKVVLSIWDGAVGSGTQLAAGNGFGGGGAGATNGLVIAVASPAAGAKTYNVGLAHATGAGTAQLEAGTGFPAFILVEAI